MNLNRPHHPPACFLKRIRMAARISSTAALLAVFCLAGCNVLGVVGYKLSGPPTIKAQYVPKQEPLLVLVENYNNPSAGEFDSDRLARQLVEELKTHKVAPAIEASAVSEYRRSHQPEYRKMSIPAVGRALGPVPGRQRPAGVGRGIRVPVHRDPVRPARDHGCRGTAAVRQSRPAGVDVGDLDREPAHRQRVAGDPLRRWDRGGEVEHVRLRGGRWSGARAAGEPHADASCIWSHLGATRPLNFRGRVIPCTWMTTPPS